MKPQFIIYLFLFWETLFFPFTSLANLPEKFPRQYCIYKSHQFSGLLGHMFGSKFNNATRGFGKLVTNTIPTSAVS